MADEAVAAESFPVKFWSCTPAFGVSSLPVVAPAAPAVGDDIFRTFTLEATRIVAVVSVLRNANGEEDKSKALQLQ